MDTPTLSVTVVYEPILADFITKAKKLRQQQRDASRKYYTNKFKITDNMTDSQKAEVAANIASRKTAYKAKYEANKELYKQRAKEYRKYRKQCEIEADLNDMTTEQLAEQ
jgi:hypothetical protein